MLVFKSNKIENLKLKIVHLWFQKYIPLRKEGLPLRPPETIYFCKFRPKGG